MPLRGIKAHGTNFDRMSRLPEVVAGSPGIRLREGHRQDPYLGLQLALTAKQCQDVPGLVEGALAGTASVKAINICESTPPFCLASIRTLGQAGSDGHWRKVLHHDVWPGTQDRNTYAPPAYIIPARFPQSCLNPWLPENLGSSPPQRFHTA